MHVAIVLYDGFDNLDAVGPFEVFGHAKQFGADLDVGLYTLEPRDVVSSSHGLRVQPDGVLPGVGGGAADGTGSGGSDAGGPDRNDETPDLVVVPGGGWGNRAEAGAWGEAERGDLPDALKRLYADGAAMASVCTGGMILARAGITDGRPAVTHHGAIEDLRESGADVVDARVVDDGDLVTAGGVTSGIDLALYLVEREFGGDIAERVATEMEYEPRGEVSGR